MTSALVGIDIQKNGVATLTLDKPPVNAMGRRIREEFLRAMDVMATSDAVGAVVLTGAGKFFCAGADIKEKGDIAPEDYPGVDRLTRDSFFVLVESPKPVIAAVNGAALGAGFVMAACCDFILADENAFFAMPEIDVGQGGGASILQRILPIGKMRRMMLTGERVPATELYRLGVVEECLPADQLLPRARELAAVIAGKSRKASGTIRSSFPAIEQLPAYDGFRVEQRYTTALSQSDEARQAREAFFKKRKAGK